MNSCKYCAWFEFYNKCKVFPDTDKAEDGWCYRFKDALDTPANELPSLTNMSALIGEMESVREPVVESYIDVPRSASGGMLTPAPTWDIVDSTKLQEYMECPRRYFYRYICGWNSEDDRNDLVFGSAWHLAIEHMMANGYDIDNVKQAYRLFEEYYRRYFNVETDEVFHPKSPSAVLYYLPAYAAKYASDFAEYEVLYIEIGGSVSIGEGRIIYFKMDSVIRRRSTGMVLSRDLKTGKTNSRAWRDKFKLSIQMGTYDHALRCLFGPDKVEGIEVSGAFFTKGNLDVMQGVKKPKPYDEGPFIIVPVTKLPGMSNVWLYNTNKWFDKLERDMAILKTVGVEKEQVMPCFDMNTQSCTDYFGCKYMDFCLAWPNPLQRVHTPPLGFIIEHWNPSVEGKTRVTL